MERVSDCDQEEQEVFPSSQQIGTFLGFYTQVSTSGNIVVKRKMTQGHWMSYMSHIKMRHSYCVVLPLDPPPNLVSSTHLKGCSPIRCSICIDRIRSLQVQWLIAEPCKWAFLLLSSHYRPSRPPRERLVHPSISVSLAISDTG